MACDDDDWLQDEDQGMGIDQGDGKPAPSGTQPEDSDGPQIAANQPSTHPENLEGAARRSPAECTTACQSQRCSTTPAETPAACSDGGDDYSPGTESEPDDSEFEGSDSGSESDADVDADDIVPVAGNVTHAARHYYKRKKKYRDKGQKLRRITSRASGISRPSAKTNHKSIKNQWKHLMRKSSGGSRAPTAHGSNSKELPPDPGGVGVCDHCDPILSTLVATCQPALLTPSERKSRLVHKRQGAGYHYTRLRILLMNHAFDHVGNPTYHNRCTRLLL